MNPNESVGGGEGDSSSHINANTNANNGHQQQQPQEQQPQQQPVTITARDLDVEDTEAEVLSLVQAQHDAQKRGSGAGAGTTADPFHGMAMDDFNTTSSNNNNDGDTNPVTATTIPASNTSHNSVVQLRIDRLEAAAAARQRRRDYLVKLAARKTQQATSFHASHRLNVMMEEEDTGFSVAYTHNHHRRQLSRSGGGGRQTPTPSVEQDGLMKAAMEVRFNQSLQQPRDPYASSWLDHHEYLLQKDSQEEEQDDPDSHSSMSQPGDLLNASSPSLPNNIAEGGLPMHHQHPHHPHRRMKSESHLLSSHNINNNNISSDNYYVATYPNGAVPPHQQQYPQQQQYQHQRQYRYNNNHQNGHYTRTNMYATGRSVYGIPTQHHYKSRGKHNKNYYKRWIPRWIRELCAMCHPYRVFENCLDILVASQFLWVGVPCLMGSAVCFYMLDNPTWSLLPNNTTIAVWLLFITRQTVTLGLARMSVYIIVDGLMLGTRLAVQTLGPLITLTAATGKGWPAIMTAWGIWNLVLIHGDTPFQMNWLFWTNMGLFNQNFGGLLVNSVLYTRVLASAILGGLCVSAKRTIFALRFGRKQVAQFKPRLKRILADVVLLDEIATLAMQADAIEEVAGTDNNNDDEESMNWDLMSPSIVQQNLNNILWVPKIEYQESTTSDFDNDESASVQSVTEEANTTPAAAAAGNNEPSKDRRASFAGSPRKKESEGKLAGAAAALELPRSESGRLKIKDMLDAWEAPDSSADKTSDISIYEILKFRRALSHLEEDNIFGDAFGSTVSRDQCIANSHTVYYRLLKLAQDSDQVDAENGRIQAGVLPFHVLALLCLGDDGLSENLAKKRKIKKLFTPDRSGELPLLAFIQAIDQCYKRLVFLRASLRNASLVDGVLERLFNGIFYFLLVLFLSSVLQLHPWTLMVSITSILVSVSFAMGSSVAGYVEGVLLIAVRRPFDLGDRIFMSSADSINPLPDVTKNSWFVQDINLTTTTLRYANTNEVCTVNNSSIASTRIVNLARSPNATVHFQFDAQISILKNNQLDEFRKEIQKYVTDRPRVWESVVHIRNDTFDVEEKKVTLTMALRHRCAWQEAGRIKNDRAEVFQFLFELGDKLEIHYEAPVEECLVYEGGRYRDHNQGSAVHFPDVETTKQQLRRRNIEI